MWASGTDFDLALRVALWSGQAALIATLGLIAWIVILRGQLNARIRRRTQLIERWRPILAGAALDPDAPVELPRLEPVDLEQFLREWNALQDSLQSNARRGLNALLEQLAVVERLRAMLRGKRVAARALATAALGHLRDTASAPALLRQLDAEHSTLSLLAARALLQIDPEQALPAILVRASERSDWPAGRFAALLHQAGPDVATEPLCTEIARGPAERTLLLLPFIRAAHAPIAADVLRKLLGSTDDERVICACLRVIDDPFLLPIVRSYLRHSRWFVRLLAVEALGRLCGPQDADAIVDLLGDEEWWVRYRAAQALVRLPWLGTEELQRIHARLDDRFARDILEQALAELKFQ